MYLSDNSAAVSRAFLEYLTPWWDSKRDASPLRISIVEASLTHDRVPLALLPVNSVSPGTRRCRQTTLQGLCRNCRHSLPHPPDTGLQSPLSLTTDLNRVKRIYPAVVCQDALTFCSVVSANAHSTAQRQQSQPSLENLTASVLSGILSD